MPQIGGLLSPIMICQSKSVKRLEAAVNKSRKDWKPIPLDKTGTRRGEEFQYWSINEFRKCVVTPLSAHGVSWKVLYVPCPATKRCTCVGVLSFEDEWQHTALEVKEGYDLMDDRGWKTQQEKIIADKMLQPITEDSKASEPEEIEDVPSKHKDWAVNWKNAAQAFDNAKTESDCQKVMSKVKAKVLEGTMNPTALKEIQFRLEARNFHKEG